MQALLAEQEQPLRRRLKWWVAVAIVLGMGIEGVQLWKLHSLSSEVEELRWFTALLARDTESTITTDVGTIQFLKRGGFSIQLDVAQYIADGLHLEGFVGNPTNLWLSNLSLKFWVTQELDRHRDGLAKDPFAVYLGPPLIGEAQCSPIASLAPGTRERFKVTIPNVKQKKEGIRMKVAFTGERYGYR